MRQSAAVEAEWFCNTRQGGGYGADPLRQHYALGCHGHDHDAGEAHSHDGGLTFHHHKKGL